MSSGSQCPGPWIVNSAPGIRAPHTLLILPSGSPTLQLDDGIGDAPVLQAHGKSTHHFLAIRPTRTLVSVDTLVQCTRCAASGLMKLPPMEADVSAAPVAFHLRRTRHRDWSHQ